MPRPHCRTQLSPVRGIDVVFQLRRTGDVAIMVADDFLELRASPATAACATDADTRLLTQDLATIVELCIGNAEAFRQQSFDIGLKTLLVLVTDDSDPPRRARRQSALNCGRHGSRLRPVSCSSNAEASRATVQARRGYQKVSGFTVFEPLCSRRPLLAMLEQRFHAGDRPGVSTTQLRLDD